MMISRSIMSCLVLGVLSLPLGNLEAAEEPMVLKIDLSDARFIVRTVPGAGEVTIDLSEAERPWNSETRPWRRVWPNWNRHWALPNRIQGLCF